MAITESRIRAVQKNAPTSGATTTQDFTVPGMGTATKIKGAIFCLTGGITNGTERNHARFAIGATDGTVHLALSIRSEDNVSTSDCGRTVTNLRCIRLINEAADTEDGAASFDSFITDGIRIDWNNYPGTAVEITCILFAGDDMQVDLEQLTVNVAVGSTVATTAPGFEPDFLIGFSAFNSNFANNPFNVAVKISLGFAANESGGIVQHSYCLMEPDNAGVNSSYIASTKNDRFTQMQRITAASPGIPLTQAGCEVTSFDTNGYTVTQRDATGTIQVAVFAVKLGGLSFATIQENNPSATGVDSNTNADMQPQAVFGLWSPLFDDDQRLNFRAGVFAFSFFNGEEEFSSAYLCEDAVSTSNTSCMTNTKALDMPDPGSTGSQRCRVDAMTAQGFDLNWEAADDPSTLVTYYFLVIQMRTGRIDESLGLTETVYRNVDFTRRADEPMGLTESVHVTPGFARRADESLGLTETVYRNVGFVRRTDSTLGLTETVYRNAGFVRRTDSTLGFTETVYRNAGFVRRTDSTLGLTETVYRNTGFVRRADEPMGLTESAHHMLGAVRRADEPLDLTETVYRNAGFVRRADEALGLTETVYRNTGFTRRTDESLGLTETVYRNAGFVRRTDSTLGLTETVYRNVGFVRRADEAMGLTETVHHMLGVVRRIDESLGLTETVYRNVGFVRRVDEALGLTETVYRIHGFIRRTDSTLGLTESVYRNAGFVRRTDESMGFTETVHRNVGIVRRADSTLGITERARPLLIDPTAIKGTTKLKVSRPGMRRGRISKPFHG